jgi:hypothetical protein
MVGWRYEAGGKNKDAECGTEIIKKRPMLTTPGDLTIAQVNEMLDQLSRATGECVSPIPLQHPTNQPMQRAATANTHQLLQQHVC